MEEVAPVEIPWERLESDVLHKLVEEFVSREGTEYGEHEIAMDTKVRQVVEQLKAKKAVITFDPETQTTHIIAKE